MKQQEPQKNNHHKQLNLKLEEDSRLWQSLKQGDTIALNDLFTKYYNDLFFYGIKFTGNREHVADKIQDLFANIWENRKNITEVANVKAYLFTALRNNLLKADPKDLIDRTDSDGDANSDYNFDISPEEIYLDNETQTESKRIIKELLEKLSPKQKEIIYLKFYGNYSNLEISVILSIKQQSVANLLARTIKTLQKKQKQHNLLFFNVLISGLL